MPKVLHDRVDLLKKRNPDMPESEAWGIATNQMKKGLLEKKSSSESKVAFPSMTAPMAAMPKITGALKTPAFLPKGVAGTAMDPRKRLMSSAKVGLENSFDQAKDGIKFKPLNKMKPATSASTSTAATATTKVGGLKLPKLDRQAMLHALAEEGLPALGATGGAALAAYNKKDPISGAALGGGVGAIPLLLKSAEERSEKVQRALHALKAEGIPALGGTLGAIGAAGLGKSPLAGAALGASIGALPELLSQKKEASESKHAYTLPELAIAAGGAGLIGGATGAKERERPVAGGIGGGLGASSGMLGGALLANKMDPQGAAGAGLALSTILGGSYLGGKAGARLLGGKKKEASDFATSEYSGPLSYGPFMARSPGGMPNSPKGIKVAGDEPSKSGKLASAALLAFNAVADWEKSANVSTPKQQLSTAQISSAKPKQSAPGPSIAQVAKPEGFGLPAPGATKEAKITKEALLEELVRLGLKDVPHTPRLVMQHRTDAERKVLGRVARMGWNKAVTAPIMGGAEKVLAKVPAGKVQEGLRASTKMLAQDPVGHGVAHALPVPGAFVAYEAGKRGLSKLLRKLDPVSVRQAATAG